MYATYKVVVSLRFNATNYHNFTTALFHRPCVACCRHVTMETVTQFYPPSVPWFRNRLI